MKIVNKTKFIKGISVILIIMIAILIITTKTYSKGEVKYKEEYIYSGDTLWSIAEKEVENNRYFENEDIRSVVYELKNINNFSSSELYEGQKIKIPVYE